MTNPNNAVGTNAGYNGRTTPNALNDVLGLFEASGVLSGWTCSPKSGMTIQLGGNGSVRDVAIAEDNAGNRTTINNRSGAPVEITLSGAPSSGSRHDAIIAYVKNPQQGSGASDTDFPSQVGIIAVKGTAAQNPGYPTEAQIKSAITADGGDGATAYRVQLADILVGQGVTTITSGNIEQGSPASLDTASLIANGSITGTKLANSTITSGKLATNAVTTAKIASAAVDHTKIDWDSMTSGTPVSLGFTTAGGTFTATHFGYVSVETAVQSGANVVIKVNNNAVARTQAGGAAFEYIPAVIPVCKGDVIQATASDGGNYAQLVPAYCFFIPLH